MDWRFILLTLSVGTLFGTAIDCIEKKISFSTGYRWDELNSSGALSNIAISNDGTSVTDPVSGNPITRKLNNINIWEIGAHMNIVAGHFLYIGADFSYGFIFSTAREILTGSLATSDESFSTAFNNSIARLNDRRRAVHAGFRLGPQIRLKGPAYFTPYFGLTYERLAFDPNNLVQTHLSNFGARLSFLINKRLKCLISCHYSLRGRRLEKILPQNHSGITFDEGASLTRGKFSGPTAQTQLDWRFAKRWRLGFSYTYRSYRSANASNGGFGGTCGFKTTWQSQLVDAALVYSF